jgi:hypothetical protein
VVGPAMIHRAFMTERQTKAMPFAAGFAISPCGSDPPGPSWTLTDKRQRTPTMAHALQAVESG